MAIYLLFGVLDGVGYLFGKEPPSKRLDYDAKKRLLQLGESIIREAPNDHRPNLEK